MSDPLQYNGHLLNHYFRSSRVGLFENTHKAEQSPYYCVRVGQMVG
jgi:hypothetical protein